MNFVTDFADQAVVLPVAGAVLMVLLVMGWRRGALAWAGCVAGVLAVMLVLKLVTLACGWRVPWTGLSSPSGHTAASAVVYGGFLALLVRPTAAGTALAALAGGLVALLFGLTRLALQVHTVADVLVGAAVGVAGAVLMRHLAGPRPRHLSWQGLALVAGIMVLLHGHRLEAETRVHWLALDLWPLSECREPSRPAAVFGSSSINGVK